MWETNYSASRKTKVFHFLSVHQTNNRLQNIYFICLFIYLLLIIISSYLFLLFNMYFYLFIIYFI